MAVQVSVCGGEKIEGTETRRKAVEFGKLIGEKGFILICGGKGGVMEAVSMGVKSKGGVTVGI